MKRDWLINIEKENNKLFKFLSTDTLFSNVFLMLDKHIIDVWDVNQKGCINI